MWSYISNVKYLESNKLRVEWWALEDQKGRVREEFEKSWSLGNKLQLEIKNLILVYINFANTDSNNIL